MNNLLLLVSLGLIVLSADWLVDGASAIACREGALMLLAFAFYYYYLFTKL